MKRPTIPEAYSTEYEDVIDAEKHMSFIG